MIDDVLFGNAGTVINENRDEQIFNVSRDHTDLDEKKRAILQQLNETQGNERKRLSALRGVERKRLSDAANTIDGVFGKVK